MFNALDHNYATLRPSNLQRLEGRKTQVHDEANNSLMGTNGPRCRRQPSVDTERQKQLI